MKGLDELLQLCTVRLRVAGGTGHGTGFFVAPGLIVTCVHVVVGVQAKRIEVFWQNQNYTAEIYLSPENSNIVGITQLTKFAIKTAYESTKVWRPRLYQFPGGDAARLQRLGSGARPTRWP